jgi:FdhD protein
MTDVHRASVRRSDGHDTDDDVAREEPLEVRIDGAPWLVVLRTPGDDLDLATGLLLAEGVIQDAEDLSTIELVGPPGAEPHAVDVTLATGVPRPTPRVRPMMSACGACGVVAARELAGASPLPTRAPALEDPNGLVSRLTELQPLFSLTGASHAAGLHVDGRLIVREDVGRHNAADKVIGAQLRAGGTTEGAVLAMSSRAGFEIVQKALRARCAAVVAVGGPTSLAVEAALWGNLLLYGFVRNDRWVRYA